MFSGGDYDEVGRWLKNFVLSHAKRENPRVEGVVETEGPDEGHSYGIRLRLGRGSLPGPDEPPVTLAFSEVADNRGGLDWCSALAARMRALARELIEAERRAKRSP